MVATQHEAAVRSANVAAILGSLALGPRTVSMAVTYGGVFAAGVDV